MKYVLLPLTVVASLFLTLEAQAFPEFSRPLPPPPERALFDSTYDFEGIVALSGCSGSLIRFVDSLDQDQAMVLTNGHCVGSIAPGEALSNRRSSRSFTVLSPDGSGLGKVHAEKLLYATMTKTDLAIYQLRETYQDILDRFQTEALLLAPEQPAVGTAIDVISGYWKRGYSCAIEAIAYSVIEGRWQFEDSIRYTRPGCEVIGGTSGSPVVAAGSREVIGVNNSINESGARCRLNNPCEVDEDGDVTFERGYGYAQQTYWVYSCRDQRGRFTLDIPGCQLPGGAASLASTP
jgi:V8-like Glu-specific endopeptidase